MEAKHQIDIYHYHGLETEKGQTQLIADCIACGKEGHMFVSPKSGLWDCKVCSASGNYITFLKHLIERSIEYTEDKDIKTLANNRGLPAKALKRYNICKNFMNDRWLVPIYSQNNKLINVYVYTPNNKCSMMTTIHLEQCLYGLESVVTGDRKPVIICEGHWDRIAMTCILRAEKKINEFCVIGTPGANIFKEDWWKYLRERDTYFLYDNDDAGKQAQRRVIKVLSQAAIKPASIHFMEWPEGTPDKFDVRDLYIKHR